MKITSYSCSETLAAHRIAVYSPSIDTLWRLEALISAELPKVVLVHLNEAESLHLTECILSSKAPDVLVPAKDAVTLARCRMSLPKESLYGSPGPGFMWYTNTMSCPPTSLAFSRPSVKRMVPDGSGRCVQVIVRVAPSFRLGGDTDISIAVTRMETPTENDAGNCSVC